MPVCACERAWMCECLHARACERAWMDAGRQRASMRGCVDVCMRVRACERGWMQGYSVRSWMCVRMQGRSPGDKYLGFFLEYCNARFSQYMYAMKFI